MVFMMGLAVGIDYSLFVVARFREERGNSLEVREAVTRSGATAGRAVAISGMTVVLALVGMLLVPHDIFISLGTAAIIVVLVSIAATLTLMPAVLTLLGDRVNSVRLPFVYRSAVHGTGGQSAFWIRISHVVMGQPVVALVLGAGVLLALAIPVLDMNLGQAGVSTFPEELESRRGFEALQRDFPAGLVSPARIVIDGDAADERVGAAIDQLLVALDADGSFGAPTQEVAQDGSLTVINVPIFGGEYQSDAAILALERLREELIPAALADAPARGLVAGDTALTVDESDQMSASMLVVIPFVLLVSFTLLTLVFRSLVVPIKAILLNLLSVGAAYGLMVLVFNKGYGNEIFGFQQVDRIENWVPLFLFAVLFGLSMDYHVFLLSRIREHFNDTGNNTESVAFGLQSTGRLITSAAMIMVAVFSGFAAGSLVMFQQMGFGLAIAVLIDATLVRSVLVPASMKLLGTKNWYFPAWLGWLPDLSDATPAKPTSEPSLP
jgi:RND superfamily putative drug exporter